MGNKKKHRSSLHSNSELSHLEAEIDDEPRKNVKRSVSCSGSRGSNPFSIVPDNYSDKNSSDDSLDHNCMNNDQNTSYFTAEESTIKVNSSFQTNDLSNYESFFDSDDNQTIKYRKEGQNDSNVLDNTSESKAQKKKGKKKEKQLQMYDEIYEKTELPSKDDVNEIFVHLKQASLKSWDVFLGFLSWIAVKLLALVVIIIQVVLLIFKYIWLVIITILYYIMKGILAILLYFDKLLLRKHDRRDPFKRNQDNANMRRITDYLKDTSDYDEIQKSTKKKRFTLVFELDETLVYTQPYRIKPKEKEDISQNPDIFKVIHPTQQQEQLFILQKRPQLDIFLLEMSKIYNLVIYSSAQKQYVDAIVDKIDTNKLISKRLYRDHCINCPGIFIKDLQNAGDISQTIILDSSPDSVKLDSANSLIISSFRGQQNDKELIRFSKIFNFIAETSTKRNISLYDSLHDFKDNFL